MGKAGAAGGEDRSAMKAAQAAEAKAAAYRETPAQKRQRIAELKERVLSSLATQSSSQLIV